MSHLSKIFSFVPPALFLFIMPAFSQLQGKIEIVPGTNSIRVSVVPDVTFNVSQSNTDNAVVTLRATSGKLQVSNFQSISGVWSSATPVIAPPESPAFDYFIFNLTSPLTTITYTAGNPLPLFSFENGYGCSLVEIIDNNTDPFLSNSSGFDITNTFSVVGAGSGQNAYAGNTMVSSVNCPPLSLSAVAGQNPVRCHGDLTSISLQAFGGEEPYEVSWINQTTGLSGDDVIPDFEGILDFPYMDPGNYIFTIHDARDSVGQANLLVAQPALLTIEVEAFDATCNGSLDGVAFVNKASGGTVANDYQYFWNTNPTVSSESIGFLDPGTYSVTVMDDNGCSASGSVEVGTYFVIFPNPHLTDISCAGAKDGVIDLYPVSPNPPYTFEWSSNVTTGDFSSAWQLEPGYYAVTITDATGVCSATAEYLVEEPPAIEVDYRMEEPRCFGDKAYISIIAVENATEPWKASIIGLGDFTEATEFEVVPGMPQRLVVEDAKGCRTTEDFLIPAKREMSIELGDNQSIKFGEEVDFNAQLFPLDNVTFEWSPTEGLSCSDCPYPIAKPTDNITYRLRMTDTSGCEISDFVSVLVRKSRDIFIPNAFSPNRDGINDKFIPYAGFEVKAIRSMQVFDRWGNMLFSSAHSFLPNDPDSGWDGSARGKTMPTGAYLYTMNVEFIDGEIILYSGDVMLME